MLVASSIADWVTGTNEELSAHKAILRNKKDKRVDQKDYSLYKKSTRAAQLTELWAVRYAIVRRHMPILYLLSSDLMMRTAHIIVGIRRFEQRSEEDPDTPFDVESVGIIGTVRAIGYKLADRVKSDEPEPNAEEDDSDSKLF